MPHLRLPSLLSVLVLLATAAPAQQAPKFYQQALQRAVAAAQQRALKDLDVYTDHSKWESAWEAKTPHFVVRTTRSYGEGMKLAMGMEQMLLNMQRTLAVDTAPVQPLRVFVLPDREAYNAFGTQWGAEHSSFYGSFHATRAPEQPVAVAYDANATLLNMQMTHSVTHQYLEQAWPGARPVWIDEGLAAYFSIFWDYKWGLAEFERMKKEGGLLALPKVLQDGLPAYALDTHARFIELGMLFYYLLRYRDDTRTTQPEEAVQQAPFRDYLTALRTNTAPPELVQRLLADPVQLERDLLAFEFPRL